MRMMTLNRNVKSNTASCMTAHINYRNYEEAVGFSRKMLNNLLDFENTKGVVTQHAFCG